MEEIGDLKCMHKDNKGSTRSKTLSQLLVGDKGQMDTLAHATLSSLWGCLHILYALVQTKGTILQQLIPKLVKFEVRTT